MSAFPKLPVEDRQAIEGYVMYVKLEKKSAQRQGSM